MRAIRRGFLLFTLLTLASNLLAQQSSTTVPNLIRYGGVLKNAHGAAISSRTVGITFLIYGQQDGGAPVWLETQNVATDVAGQYSVLLGSTTATGLPSDLFAQQEQRWLAVKAEGQSEQPRVLLVSVPYAMKAAVADTLAGHSVNEFVTNDALQSAVQRQLQGQASTAPGFSSLTANSKSTKSGMNTPLVTNPATSFVDTTANQVVLVQQNGTGVGLKASSPNNVGVLGTVSSTAKAGIVAGVEGTSTINNGYGVFGYSTAASGGIGAQGRSDSSNGIGLRGFTIGTNGVAVNALSNATSGTPVGLLSSISAPGGTGALITNVATGTITGPLISATTKTGTQFSVDGKGNVKFGEGLATLSIGSAADHNLFLGVGAGSSNVVGQGTWNSFFGYQSGNSNTSGFAGTFTGYQSGLFNTTGGGNVFTGYQAGYTNNTGGGNVFTGYQAGYANYAGSFNVFSGAVAGYKNGTGSYNTFTGVEAGYNNDTGSYNLFSGDRAGYGNTVGGANVFSGYQAGYNSLQGNWNTFAGVYAGYSSSFGDGNVFVGFQAASNNLTGDLNTVIGYNAGQNSITGANNIYIGENSGPDPANAGEGSVIRIGNSDQTVTYVAGIYGAYAGNAPLAVYVEPSGKLSTPYASSRRFKEEIRDMGDRSSALMELRPVTFLYRPDYQTGTRTLQYGLIAEEVAEVYPDLVAYEADGQPRTVLYQHLAPMLLNELQKQYHRAQDEDVLNRQQGEQIEAQRREIETLKAELRLQNAAFQERLSRLESMVGTQTQIAADLPQH